MVVRELEQLSVNILAFLVHDFNLKYNSFIYNSVVSAGFDHYLPSRHDVMLCDLPSGKFLQYSKLSVGVAVGQLECLCSLLVFRPFHSPPYLPHNKKMERREKQRGRGESEGRAPRGKDWPLGRGRTG